MFIASLTTFSAVNYERYMRGDLSTGISSMSDEKTSSVELRCRHVHFRNLGSRFEHLS